MLLVIPFFFLPKILPIGFLPIDLPIDLALSCSSLEVLSLHQPLDTVNQGFTANVRVYTFLFLIFIYLAASSLSCGIRGLCCGVQAQ